MNRNTRRVAGWALFRFVFGSLSLCPFLFAQSTGRKAIEPRQIASPGIPGAVVAFGDQSRVLAVGRSGASFAPVIAAGQMPGSRAGRIVLFGHDGYLLSETLDKFETRSFFFETAKWAARNGGTRQRKAARPTVGLIGVGELAPSFAAQGWDVRVLDGPWHKRLGSLDLVVLTAFSASTRDQVRAIDGFVKNGGGLLVGLTGWGWEQTHPGKTLAADLPLRTTLAEAGLAITPMTLEPADAKIGSMQVIRPDEMPFVHAGRALARLSEISKSPGQPDPQEASQVSSSLEMAALAIGKQDSPFRKTLISLVSGHSQKPITLSRPVLKKDLMERIAVRFRHDLTAAESATKKNPDPSAADFPGNVSDRAPRITGEIRLPAGSKGRLGTGLYAPPGAAIGLRVVAGSVPNGLQVRIGAHSDTLWHLDTWQRNPEITRIRDFPTVSPEITFANPFGGLVYFEPSAPLAQDLTIRVEHVVQAPHYVLGETTKERWTGMRKAPAPWAELRSRHVGLVLPSEIVREMADPQPLMELWDRIVECQDELCPLGDGSMPTQWVVPDRQISAGYMHSGQPIMTGLDAVPFFASVEKLIHNPAPGGVTWGILHEIGHNRQRQAWTPSGTGEVTNNLFALYAIEKLIGKRSSGHDSLLTGSKRTEALAKYRATGPDFEVLKQDPFLALAFFMEIQESFGWNPFIEHFVACEKLKGAESPRTDEARWSLWLTGLSHSTGKNLAPHFEAWGIPVTAEAVKSVESLPKWNPPSVKP